MFMAQAGLTSACVSCCEIRTVPGMMGIAVAIPDTSIELLSGAVLALCLDE